MSAPIDWLAVLYRQRNLRRGISNCVFFSATTIDGAEIKASGETQDKADDRLVWQLNAIARSGGAA